MHMAYYSTKIVSHYIQHTHCDVVASLVLCAILSQTCRMTCACIIPTMCCVSVMMTVRCTERSYVLWNIETAHNAPGTRTTRVRSRSRSVRIIKAHAHEQRTSQYCSVCSLTLGTIAMVSCCCVLFRVCVVRVCTLGPRGEPNDRAHVRIALIIINHAEHGRAFAMPRLAWCACRTSHVRLASVLSIFLMSFYRNVVSASGDARPLDA